MRRISPSSLEITLVYDAFGALHSVTDTYGRRIGFEWIMVQDLPFATLKATLPDGTHIDFIYDTVTTSAAIPEKLFQVARRDASNNLLDKTSYQHGDARLPYAITAVLDKDDVVRWTVTHDAYDRAETSAARLGVASETVTYSADGTTVSRTVTGGPFEVRVGEAGDYQVSLGSGAWVEMVSGETALVSSAHAPGPACTSLRKTVVFQLKPGTYLLEITGNGEASLPLMVSRIAK